MAPAGNITQLSASKQVARQVKKALELHQGGFHAQALALVEEALRQQPGDVVANNLMGHLLREQGRLQEARGYFMTALAYAPNSAEIHSNLGVTLRELGEQHIAETHLRRAIALNPQFPDALSNLGNLLKDSQRLQEALDCYRVALALKPDYGECHYNAGIAYRELGDLDKAITHYRRAIESLPDHAGAKFNLGVSLLLQGKYLEGWPYYEWRFRVAGVDYPQFDVPRWQGELEKNKTLLLYAEQGLGDSIQFARFVPRVAAMGLKVTLQVRRPLLPLLEQLSDYATVIAHDQAPAAFDYHLPLLSLGEVLRITPANIDGRAYLRADEHLRAHWRQRLKSDAALRIGLVWAGNPGHRKNQARSMQFKDLAPLCSLEGIQYYSLQMGEKVNQLQDYRHLPVIDLSSELLDFAHTAAAISQLDLVVTVDTSVAHLAGALGKPVWIMLPFVPDWRWQLERENSHWYHSARLFRQTQLQDWASVVEEVKQEVVKVRDKK